MSDIYLKLLYGNLKEIISSCVVKYGRKADLYETINSKKDSDKYISAAMGLDSFNTYTSFHEEAYEKIGIFDVDLIIEYNQNKLLIPFEKRDPLVKEQRKIIVRDYEEQNNYYRSLIGLPDTDDYVFIFIDDETCLQMDIDPNTPIHELSDSKIATLKHSGYIDNLKLQYPSKKYLNFLGMDKIDLMTARNALNFTILKYNKSKINTGIYSQFITTYSQCREYFMSVIYSVDMANRYDMYDNFIALMIMVMTIQRMVTLQFKAGLDRDFYDLDIIQLFFESYRVPFIKELNLTQQRALMRNLNNLLRFKSTDKVIFDICEILGFAQVDIYKYMLMKEHKLDENEEPIFIYKDKEDPITGEVSQVEDVDAMYDYHFKSVNIKETDISLTLSQSNERIEYDDMIVGDEYWWDNDELKNKMDETQFNYIESKYMGMNVMYKMAEITFETAYLFSMLFDKRSEIEDIKVQLPKIVDVEVSLFDTAVFLCALLSRKNGFKGNVLLSPSKILSIYGFNFDTDFEEIRKFINANSDTINPIVLRYIENLHISTPDDVNRLFFNIKGLDAFLVDKISKSRDLKEYRLYKKLYDSLLYTNNTNKMFTMTNGKKATTYMEYLDNERPELYQAIMYNDDETSINEMMQHTLYKLGEIIDDLSNLDFMNDDIDLVLTALTKLVSFFKSYTVDLTTYNIYYILDHRMFNMIKLIDTVSSEKTNEYKDKAGLTYSDEINDYRVEIQKLFRLKLSEYGYMKLVYNLKHDMEISDKYSTAKWQEFFDKSMTLQYNDLVKWFITEVETHDQMTILESIMSVVYIDGKVNFKLLDSIKSSSKETDYFKNLTVRDLQDLVTKVTNEGTNISIYDSFIYYLYMLESENVILDIDTKWYKSIVKRFDVNYLDRYSLDKRTLINDTMYSLRDCVSKLMGCIYGKEKIEMRHRQDVDKVVEDRMCVVCFDDYGMVTVDTNREYFYTTDILASEIVIGSNTSISFRDVVTFEKETI